MLTLVRAPRARGKGQASAQRCSWNDLPRAGDPPQLRLVGGGPARAEPTPEQREVLAIAVDRMIDEALRQLTQERRVTRARLARSAAAPTR